MELKAAPSPHPAAECPTKAGRLERLAQAVTLWSGGEAAFAIAFLIVLIWAVTGPLFHFSDDWQMVINTITSVATFLMVFLIQRSQNKESRAVQLKLNEIVAAIDGASNRLIAAEELSEAQLEILSHRSRGLRGQHEASDPPPTGGRGGVESPRHAHTEPRD